MSGRPKGTTKSDRKKLQTYRLSAIEKYEVENLLTVMRGKPTISLPDIRKFDFKTGRLRPNYIYIDLLPEQIQFLYIIVNNDDMDKSLIVKCPVIQTNTKSYILNIHTRNFSKFDTDWQKGSLITFKVNKTSLKHTGLSDFNLTHYHSDTFKTLDEVLCALYLNYLKPIIIRELSVSNDIALIHQFLNILANRTANESMALEYVYKALDLDLFSIEDDTV